MSQFPPSNTVGERPFRPSLLSPPFVVCLLWLTLSLLTASLPLIAAQSSSTGSATNTNGVATNFCGYREFRFDWLATYDLVYSYVDEYDYGGPYNISYYFRACGNITAPACASIEGTSVSPMLCQYTMGGSAVSLAYYTPSNAYWSIPEEGVVQMYLQDGAVCNGAPRTTIVEYYCDPTVVGYPLNFTVGEGVSCTYYVFVATSFACGAEPDGNYALGYTPSTAQCNYAGYNLSSLASRDLTAYVVDDSYGGPYFVYYYYRPCGVVANTACSVALANLVPSVCQYTIGGAAVDLAVYRPDLETWSVIPNGIQSSVQDGTTCSNGIERTVIVQWLCNATATNPTNFTVSSGSVCTYVLQIQTVLVCNVTHTSSTASPSTSIASTAVFSSSSASAPSPATSSSMLNSGFSTGLSTANTGSTSASSSAGPSTGSSSVDSSDSSSSGLSHNNKIAVGVALGVGIPLLVAIVALCCVCKRTLVVSGKKELNHSRVEDDSISAGDVEMGVAD